MTSAPKARLATGKRVTVLSAEQMQPGLGAHSPAIVTETDAGSAVVVRAGRHLLRTVALVALLLCAVYVTLACTVVVVLRSAGHNVLVLRGAFPEGQAPIDGLVYASSQPAAYGILGKFQAATVGVPAGSVVRILSGNNASVATGPDGHIVVDGKRTRYIGKVHQMNLTREYIALCVAGACKPGDTVLIPEGNILGAAKGYLTFTGITTPTLDAGSATSTPAKVK